MVNDLEESNGFSLIELLIVLSIISLLFAFIIPSFKTTTSHAEDRIMSSQLLRAIQLAQTEAMMRQELVMLKKLSGDWQQGYVIATHDNILHHFSNQKNAGKLHWRVFPIHSDHLQFLRTGATSFENGTFWYCPKHSTKPRWAIVVNQAGRARMVYPNKWGDIESANPLLC